MTTKKIPPNTAPTIKPVKAYDTGGVVGSGFDEEAVDINVGLGMDVVDAKMDVVDSKTDVGRR